MRNFLTITKLAVRFLKICLKHFLISLAFILKDNTALASYPIDVVENLARAFYPIVEEFFENEENRKAFEEWKKNRELQKASSTN